MTRRNRWAAGLALLTLAGGAAALLGAPDAKIPDVAKNLVGEWSLSTTRAKPNDSVVVWTFKSDGIVRLDAIDHESRKKVREMPMVGRWRVEDGDVICTWEVWNDTEDRPAEAEERFRVRALSETELILQLVSQRGKPVTEAKLFRYSRFELWGKQQ